MKKLPYIVLFTLLATSCLTSCGKKEVQETTENIPEEYIYTELKPGGVVVYVTECTTAETTIEPQELDAFENVAYYLDKYSGTYRDNKEFSIDLDLSDCPYADYMHYSMEIISADNENIKIRVTAETEELTDWLKDRSCSFITNTMDFEIPVSEIPTKLISEQLYQDNKDAIDKVILDKLQLEVSEFNDSVELKEIILSLPASDSVDVTEQLPVFSNKSDGTGNRSHVLLTQFNAEYSVYEIFESESGYYLACCTPNFKNSVYEEYYDTFILEDGLETQENRDSKLIPYNQSENVYVYPTKEDCDARIKELIAEDQEQVKLIAVVK